jgi:rhodanese-related sulfurtransferase
VKVGESKVVDIRKDSEYSAEHVDEAYSKPLANINEWIRISTLKSLLSSLRGRYQHDCSFYITGTVLEIFQKLKVLMLLQNFSTNHRFCLPK